jgi:hypothetical protein
MSSKVPTDVRLRRVVARAALIAALASVIVSGLVGSRIPSALTAIDPSAFQAVGVDHSWVAMTALKFDPNDQSAGRLEAGDILREPQPATVGTVLPRPVVDLPNPPLVKLLWTYDPEISWYGPGFYGHQGACGLVPGGIQADTIGVAHRTLPCGTRVTFRYNGRTVTTIVIDRGPYVSGRIWDMTRGLCAALQHCFTGGGVYYHIG